MLRLDRMTSPHTPDIFRWRSWLSGAALGFFALASLAGCADPPQEEPVIAMINGRSRYRRVFSRISSN
jgi:hypothetical protein